MSRIIIPEILQSKIIPKNNYNPLHALSAEFGYNVFGDLSQEILNSIYSKYPQDFWAVIHQIAFFGVQFTGSMDRFNSDVDSVFFVNESYHTDRIEIIAPFGRLNYKLKQNGIVTKGDMHLVPVESLSKGQEDWATYVEFLNRQNIFAVDKDSLVSHKLDLEFTNKKDEVVFSCKGVSYSLPVELVEKPITFNDFTGSAKILVRGLLRSGYSNLTTVPDDISFFSDFRGVGSIAVDDFFKQLKNSLPVTKPNHPPQRAPVYSTLTPTAKDTMIFECNDVRYAVSKEHLDTPINHQIFNSTPRLVQGLLNDGYSHLNKLPENISFLTDYKHVGQKVVEKFFNQIGNINIQYGADTPYLSAKDTGKITCFGTNEAMSLIDHWAESNIGEVVSIDSWIVDTLHKNGISKINELPSDLTYLQSGFKFGKRKVEELFLAIKNSRPFSVVLDELCARIAIVRNNPKTVPFMETREWEFFQYRYLGGPRKTLQEVGDKFGVTRERARQILRKASQSFMSGLNQITESIEQVLSSEKIVFVADILNLSTDDVQSLEYVYDNMSVEFRIIDKQLISSLSTVEFESFIVALTDRIVSELNNTGYFLSNRELLQQRLAEAVVTTSESANVVKWLTEYLLKYYFTESNHGYYPNSMTKAEKCESILEKEFPNGIFIYKDIEQFRTKLLDCFEHDFKGDTSRSIIGNLLRNEKKVLLWDWGFYIHISHLNKNINYVTLQPIVDWLLDKLTSNPQLMSNSAFLEFEDSCISMGIPNEHALYSCLKLFAVDFFHLPKSPKIFRRGSDSLTNIELLEQFFLDKQREVSMNEIEREFTFERGWKDFMIASALTYSNNLLRSGDNTYVHLHVLSVDIDSFQQTIHYLRSKLSKETPNISVRLLFEEKKPSLLSQGITNDRLLYSLIAYHFNDDYDCSRYPYIQLRVPGLQLEEMTSKKIYEQYFLAAKGTIFRNEVYEEFNTKRGWTTNSLYNVISNTDSVVAYIDQSEYIHVSKLEWNEEKYIQLETVLMMVWEKAVIASGRFTGSLNQDILASNFSDSLPPIGTYSWTEDLMRSFLSKSKKFHLLGTKKRLFVPIPNDFDIFIDTDLVAHIIRTEYNGAVKVKTLEKRLVQLDAITQNFPKSYESCEHYILKNDELILYELMEETC